MPCQYSAHNLKDYNLCIELEGLITLFHSNSFKPQINCMKLKKKKKDTLVSENKLLPSVDLTHYLLAKVSRMSTEKM